MNGPKGFSLGQTLFTCTGTRPSSHKNLSVRWGECEIALSILFLRSSDATKMKLSGIAFVSVVLESTHHVTKGYTSGHGRRSHCPPAFTSLKPLTTQSACRTSSSADSPASSSTKRGSGTRLSKQDLLTVPKIDRNYHTEVERWRIDALTNLTNENKATTRDETIQLAAKICNGQQWLKWGWVLSQ